MHRTRRLAPWLSAIAVLLLAAAGPGTRLGLWDFRTGFLLLRLGAYLGLGGAGLGLVGLLWRPAGSRLWPPLVAIGLGAVAALVPWTWMQQARRVPPIHDITTDTERPPEFVAVLPLRSGAPNSAEYGGEEVAAQQRAAYPDVVPLRLDRAPAEAYARALAAARESGWEIVAADSAAGRIEATATTGWFGFKDDVVIRVTPEGTGSRIDARSVSRVGGSDVGANAKRIRDFLGRTRRGG
ncbi:MAG TPA: DUF1499 domain-containing protein [Gemmatimonadales bacterium]|nr:DUF1499 domain-containing protein [Gemmatimonadales bacterium]